MVITVHRVVVLLALVFVNEVVAKNYEADSELESYGEKELADLIPYVTNDKYIRNIHSMINAYRNDAMNGRMMMTIDTRLDSKYKSWKRNADLINSLLALPKDMNEAGR